MHAIPRTPVNGHVRETQVPPTFDNATSLPPLIRRFPSEANPAELPVATLSWGGALAPEATGAEVWYAVCLSAFLVGLLVLGGFWIWLNVRFL